MTFYQRTRVVLVPVPNNNVLPEVPLVIVRGNQVPGTRTEYLVHLVLVLQSTEYQYQVRVILLVPVGVPGTRTRVLYQVPGTPYSVQVLVPGT